MSKCTHINKEYNKTLNTSYFYNILGNSLAHCLGFYMWQDTNFNISRIGLFLKPREIIDLKW